MKKTAIVIMLTLFLAISACHKGKNAIELITGQYFDWNTQTKNVFVIDDNPYHIVNIHDISREDLETSTVISDEVSITELDDKYYIEQGRVKNELTYYLIRCEKLELYLLVPHEVHRSLLDHSRPLGYCLEQLTES